MSERAEQLRAPESVLPHRPPFLFLDEVTTLDPSGTATGRWHLSGT